jgi:hypothetical protein
VIIDGNVAGVCGGVNRTAIYCSLPLSTDQATLCYSPFYEIERVSGRISILNKADNTTMMLDCIGTGCDTSSSWEGSHFVADGGWSCVCVCVQPNLTQFDASDRLGVF